MTYLFFPKNRADVFFRLKQDEFITYADGKDMKVQFKLANIQRESLRQSQEFTSENLLQNFDKIYSEVKSIFNQ